MVSFLSPAMSTASAEVDEVMVARIRRWYRPCPSWTSDWSLSRMKGMSRLTASSMSAWVEGPKAVRSARWIRPSSATMKSKAGSGRTR